MTQTALLLGGYGLAGVAAARLLLRETSLGLVVAGRNAERAAAAAAALNDELGGDRVRGRGVDAADPASLTAALEGCGLVIVCAPLEDVASKVVRAALDAGVDWIDISLGARKLEALGQLAEEIERRGACFVTEAGVTPGLPAALVRLAHERLGVSVPLRSRWSCGSRGPHPARRWT